jgi:molybdate transport system permease protein
LDTEYGGRLATGLAHPKACRQCNVYPDVHRDADSLVAVTYHGLVQAPPTVLGFYLLLLLGPKGFVGQLTQAMGLGTLPFTFAGLVVASVIYSMPFVVQPLQNTFESLGNRHLEVAATLRASRWDSFVTVIVPLARPGFLTAAVLSFAHTVGEFGVVLMIGGNIPGETKVLSVAIYDHVESLEYAKANFIAGTMLLFSFLVLVILYLLNGRLIRGHQS